MKKTLIVLFFLFVTKIGFAQVDNNVHSHQLTVVIPEVAIIDIESSVGKDFTFAYSAPTEAGNSVTNPNPNTNLWLNYSSIKSAADPTRSVLVKINASVTGGITFSVFALPPIGGVGGLPIFPSPQVSLTTTNQTLVAGIGSCYTGNGAGVGHQLLYSSSFVPLSYSDIKATNQAFNVLYTLTDNL